MAVLSLAATPRRRARSPVSAWAQPQRKLDGALTAGLGRRGRTDHAPVQDRESRKNHFCSDIPIMPKSPGAA